MWSAEWTNGAKVHLIDVPHWTDCQSMIPGITPDSLKSRGLALRLLELSDQ